MSKFNTAVAIVFLSLGAIVPNQLTLATEKSPIPQNNPQQPYQTSVINQYETKNIKKSDNRRVKVSLISKDKVKFIIKLAANKYKVNYDLLLTVADCESKLNPQKRGDNGESFGLWQIHLPDHPDITKEQAIDPYWSTNWSVDQISRGNGDLWTCYRKI